MTFSVSDGSLEKILRVIEKYDLCGDVTWDSDLNFYVQCNDLFYWGSASCEPLTVDTLPELIRAMKDCERHGELLYCSRMRKMRPQGEYYQYFDQETEWHLFHECGEERKVGGLNPTDPESFLTQSTK